MKTGRTEMMQGIKDSLLRGDTVVEETVQKTPGVGH